MSNLGFDPLSPWLRFRPPPEDLPGFRVRPVDVAPNGVPGLAGWQPDATPTGPACAEQRPARHSSRRAYVQSGFDPLAPWRSFGRRWKICPVSGCAR